MGTHRSPSGTLLLGVFALALGGPGAARAVTVTYAFEGVVTTLVRDQGLFGAPGTVQLGDPFTGRIRYEVGPANPDQLPPDTTLGGYDLIELVIDQSTLPALVPGLIGITHAPGLPTLPPLPADPGRDWFVARATGDARYPSVLLRLQGPFGSAFSDDALPETLDLADFPDGAFLQGLVAVGIGGSPSIEDVGAITSLTLVPEPGTLGLVAAALALLAARRRAPAR